MAGHLHPITQTIEDIVRIFGELGFSVANGPEIETEYYNFDALNIPADHPARDLWDTFWLSDGRLLRTHTSPVQVRYMEKHKPPIRIIVPGKVYRFEATDATHEAQFFQVEGLYVDKNVSLAELKGTITEFFKRFIGKDVKLRFRPSFFPFVEPGIEVDIARGGKWLEVMGAGMVHPKVLERVGIDPKKYQGFAFGGGIDRFLMVKYGIPDIRLLWENDLRLLEQF